MNTKTLFILLFCLFLACTGRINTRNNDKISNTMESDTLKQYGYNLKFLKKYSDVIELRTGQSFVAIVPEWQGRVMTSSSEGEAGFSFGWINHDLIKSGGRLPHINAFGGEERLWLGPEGGQFSIFFRRSTEFKYENWQTPAFLDTIPFILSSKTDTSALFRFDTEIENYSGTTFKIGIEREIILLSNKMISRMTGIDLDSLNAVGYQSNNKLENKGSNEWKKESGLLSIWMLGMFNPSPAVTVVIPVKDGDDAVIGARVNDNYFGKISSDRLKIAGDKIFFRADGKSRGKIGIPPLRSKGIMGSYDSENNILTLLICKSPGSGRRYVNSAWEIQDDPFSGDALNSYNDGPLADGTQMGPFYELETSSPAAALKPGESIIHSQMTIHITGNKEAIKKAIYKTLDVSLEEIENAFK